MSSNEINVYKVGKMYVELTQDEAKRAGLNESSRLSEREASDYWKSRAKQISSESSEQSTIKPKETQKTNNATTSSNIKARVQSAKETGMFDMEFLERNLDEDPRTGDPLEGKELYDAYEKFLKEKEKQK